MCIIFCDFFIFNSKRNCTHSKQEEHSRVQYDFCFKKILKIVTDHEMRVQKWIEKEKNMIENLCNPPPKAGRRQCGFCFNVNYIFLWMWIKYAEGKGILNKFKVC